MLYVILLLLFVACAAAIYLPVFRQHKTLALSCIAILTVGSSGLYAYLGSPLLLPIIDKREREMQTLANRIVELSTLVQTHPNDIGAWAELGKSAMEAHEFFMSAEAYRKAVLLSRGDVGLIVQYAKALIFAADGTVTKEARRSLDMALKLDAKHQEARYFLALAKLQEGKAEEGMKIMKKLYAELDADAPLKKIIDRQIGRDTEK